MNNHREQFEKETKISEQKNGAQWFHEKYIEWLESKLKEGDAIIDEALDTEGTPNIHKILNK